MLRRIYFLGKRGFLQKNGNSTREILFSQLLLIPLFLVIISGLLIKSIQADILVSNYLSHVLTGILGTSSKEVSVTPADIRSDGCFCTISVMNCCLLFFI